MLEPSRAGSLCSGSLEVGRFHCTILRSPQRTTQGWPVPRITAARLGLPRRPVRSPAQNVAGPFGYRAKTPIPVILYRSIPLTWSVPRADLGRQISVEFAVHPGSLAPRPKPPFGVLLEDQEQHPPHSDAALVSCPCLRCFFDVIVRTLWLLMCGLGGSPPGEKPAPPLTYVQPPPKPWFKADIRDK